MRFWESRVCSVKTVSQIITCRSWNPIKGEQVVFAIELSGGRDKYKGYCHRMQWKVYQQNSNNNIGVLHFQLKGII